MTKARLLHGTAMQRGAVRSALLLWLAGSFLGCATLWQSAEAREAEKALTQLDAMLTEAAEIRSGLDPEQRLWRGRQLPLADFEDKTYALDDWEHRLAKARRNLDAKLAAHRADPKDEKLRKELGALAKWALKLRTLFERAVA